MKKFYTNKHIRWVFAAAGVCVLVLVFEAYKNLRYVYKDNKNLQAQVEEMIFFENIYRHVQAVDSGQMLYLKEDNEDLLDRYYVGMAGLKRDTARLRTILAQADTTQAKILSPLLTRLSNKYGYAVQVIDDRRLNDYDSLKSLRIIQQNKLLTDSIRSQVGKLQNYDRRRLLNASENRATFSENLSYQFYLLALMFVVFLVAAYYMTNRDFKKILKAEQQLKFNASVLRNVSDPIVTTDMTNKITNWNSYAEELYGYKEQEVLGKNANDVFGIDSGKDLLTEIKNPGSSKDFWKGELIHKHKDGREINIDASVSSIIDDTDQKAGLVRVLRDITERKQTAEKLQRLTVHLEEEVKIKAAELNNVFERITDAFIALDNQWNYTYVNNRAAELYKRSIEDLVGKNIWEEYPNVVEEPFYQALQTAKATGKAQRAELYYSKTGQWFEDLIYPSADGISVYYHDITDKKNAELNLQKAHEKLNYHINNTPMGFVELDKDLNIKQWSKRAEEIFGWTKEELPKNAMVNKLVYPLDVPLAEETIEAIFTGKGHNNILQVRNMTKSGKVLYCDWYISVLKDENGKFAGVMGMVQNITERMQIQKNLEEAEFKFRSLVEQSMVGVYIVQSDKFTYVNPRLLELTGYDEHELINKLSVSDLVMPEDRPKVVQTLSQRLKGNLKSMNYELRGLKKNGEMFYAEVFGTLTQYLGKPAIIGTLIDVTIKHESLERIRESQEALRKSNERFLLVAQATNDAVWDWNIAEDSIWGNEIFSGFFNVPLGSNVDFESFKQRLHPDDRERMLQHQQDAFRLRKEIVVEQFRFLTADGNYITINDRASILYDERGKPIRMLGAMQDITEQKRNEQQITLEKELSDNIINSLPGVFYLYNRQGHFYRWNQNLTEVTGYTDAEMASMHPLDLFDVDEKPMLAYKIDRVFAHGKDFVEAKLRAKDGSKIPFYFTGQLIQYEGEVCLMGVGLDISDKIRSQEELAKSEEKYRTIIEQASDGIFISDMNGRCEEINSKGVRLTGYSKEELLQMSIFDLMQAEHIINNPPKLHRLLDGNVVLSERMLRTKAGEALEVEVSAKLLADGRFVGIVRDITERKKTQEALRKSEEKYRLLFNQNPMPMWMLSRPHNKFLDVNNAAIEFYGYSKPEFLKMTGHDIWSQHNNLPQDAEHAADFAGVWEHQKKNGTKIKVNIIAHNIVYEGTDAMLVLANDVTQKLEAEEALNKSHMELRQLATHLEKVRETERTHIAREIHDELGQQLTGLKMDISWLNRKIKNQEAEVHAKIAETILLIDTTVKTVRRIATELRPSILDDLGLVAALEWQSEEFEKRFEIKALFKSNVPEVKVSADLATGIFRIYQECLTNVLRHSQATTVSSSLAIEDKVLKLNIVDNGKGFIAKEIANKKTLGLLGMKERTNLLGGSYEITSSPGQGTSVLIIVPLSNS
ncbi:MAG: PAS domain S-box protein [Chitinophagaceae bacterium]|nr:MAG: PAS domain S-box protein [Chitinophagaceae bacterium]